MPPIVDAAVPRDMGAERVVDASVRLDSAPDSSSPDLAVDAGPALDAAGDTADGPAADTATDAGTDAVADAGTDATDAGVDVTADLAPDLTPDTTPVDTAALVINNCNTYEDGRGGSNPNDNRYVDWNNSTFPSAVERCLLIQVGQSVIFGGDFVTHPLEASGGDLPAIVGRSTTVDGPPDDYTVAFPTAGTFGYRCTNHPGTMLGAIRVVP